MLLADINLQETGTNQVIRPKILTDTPLFVAGFILQVFIHKEGQLDTQYLRYRTLSEIPYRSLTFTNKLDKSIFLRIANKSFSNNLSDSEGKFLVLLV